MSEISNHPVAVDFGHRFLHIYSYIHTINEDPFVRPARQPTRADSRDCVPPEITLRIAIRQMFFENDDDVDDDHRARLIMDGR